MTVEILYENGRIHTMNGARPTAEAMLVRDGRIAAVNTTGFRDFTTRLRKYAVSSIVSVPWVMTTPATSGIATSSLTRRARLSQTSSFMS